jgi:hypothetical protein
MIRSCPRPITSILLVATAALLCFAQCNPPPPCSTPEGGVLASLTGGECGRFLRTLYNLAQGSSAYTVTVGDHNLPIELVSGDLRAVLQWNANATVVTVTITRGGQSETRTYAVSQSGGAGRAILPDPILGPVQDTVAPVAVRVLTDPASATDEPWPPPSAAGDENQARSAVADAKLIVATFQSISPFVDMHDYLNYLNTESLAWSAFAEAMRNDLAASGRSPSTLESLTLAGAEAIARILTNISNHQQMACIPCTEQCGLGCYGACRTTGGGLTGCQVLRSTNCRPPSVFTPDVGCLSGDHGACCMRSTTDESLGCRTDFGELACTDVRGHFLSLGTCDQCAPAGACCMEDWDCTAAWNELECQNLARQYGRAWWTFHADANCETLRSDDLCSDGACCYTDAGGGYRCVHGGRSDCLGDGRPNYFQAGRCAPETCGQ